MIYSKENFTVNSFAKWSYKSHSKLINKYKPDYTSESGSKYWYSKKGVYRYSNHWGDIGNCIWIKRDNTNSSNEWCLLFCKWEYFKEVFFCETKSQYQKLLHQKVRFYLFGRRIDKSAIELFKNENGFVWRTPIHPNHYGNNYIKYTF